MIQRQHIDGKTDRYIKSDSTADVWLSDRCTTEGPVGGASATAGGERDVSKNINRNKKAETESKREWERDKDRRRAVGLNKQPNFVVVYKLEKPTMFGDLSL